MPPMRDPEARLCLTRQYVLGPSTTWVVTKCWLNEWVTLIPGPG